nr:MAG TPA: hypothetical protein [Caudoviricetes sp.]
MKPEGTDGGLLNRFVPQGKGFESSVLRQKRRGAAEVKDHRDRPERAPNSSSTPLNMVCKRKPETKPRAPLHDVSQRGHFKQHHEPKGDKTT